MTREKLPPRLNLRGISLAARAVSHEIRDFTKRKTGKDLADIRNSKVRNDAIKKLSELKVSIGSEDAKNNLLAIACNHSTNFTKSLSPDGVESIDSDLGFRKHNPHSLVARYHKQCRRDEQFSLSKISPSTLNKNTTVFTNKIELPKKKLCGCNESVHEKGCSFLSCWEHKGIKEEDMNSFFTENMPCFKKSSLLQEIEESLSDYKEWKEFLRNDKCTVFRKRLPSGIYEYRVQASFNDVSAKNLFRTQVDGDYRKKWDSYVIDLKVVESNPETSSELVHWVTKCPYPFATREYVYLRRQKIDAENKAMILYQQATDKTNIPQDPKVTRIDTYLSKIIIKPHSEDFNQTGCDFLLSYYDNPKMMLPTRVIDLAASRGIADSVNRMYKAAKELDSSSD